MLCIIVRCPEAGNAALLASKLHAAAVRDGEGAEMVWNGSPADPTPPFGDGATGGGRPILIVLHQERSTPGRVGRLLQAMGYALDVRRPRFGDPLPDTMARHAGAVIFGGPMSANDPEPWIRTEIDWVEVPLREGAPLLGLCLGAQMIARQLGQDVHAHADGHVEIGYYPIAPTAAGDTLVGEPMPRWVYHWHSEGFGLPPGAEALASGTDFECQAFRYGRSAVGLQFHPEVTYAMMSRWIVLGHDLAHAKNARPVHQHRPDWFLHDAPVARWAGAFLEVWAADALPERCIPLVGAGPRCDVATPAARVRLAAGRDGQIPLSDADLPSSLLTPM